MIQGLWCSICFQFRHFICCSVHARWILHHCQMCFFFFNTFLLVFFFTYQFHCGPHTWYIHYPNRSFCTLYCVSLIFSFNSSFCFLVKSCGMFTLLNGASDSLILFRFWNISYFLFLSFSEISNGHCLWSAAFPSLIACSVIPWSKVILIMLL